MFPHIVQRADVRMRQLGDRPRFAIEAVTEPRIGSQEFRQDLDGDRAVEPCRWPDTPIPPAPSGAPISYGPSRLPTGRAIGR